MHTLERSVQRFADNRHDSLVQVNSRPVRCLRREACLSNPYAEATKARGEFCPAPQANSETSFPRSTESVCLSPPSKRPLQRSHHRWWDQSKVIIQGVCNALGSSTSTPLQS